MPPPTLLLISTHRAKHRFIELTVLNCVRSLPLPAPRSSTLAGRGRVAAPRTTSLISLLPALPLSPQAIGMICVAAEKDHYVGHATAPRAPAAALGVIEIRDTHEVATDEADACALYPDGLVLVAVELVE